MFTLTPSGSGWSYTSSYFENNGYNPIGGVTLNANGILFGTTSEGGAHGVGVVWAIAP